MNVKFDGGPINGVQLRLPDSFGSPNLEIHVSDELAGLPAERLGMGVVAWTLDDGAKNMIVPLKIGGKAPWTRYVLMQMDDRKDIAIYYVPTASLPARTHVQRLLAALRTIRRELAGDVVSVEQRPRTMTGGCVLHLKLKSGEIVDVELSMEDQERFVAALNAAGPGGPPPL